MDEVKKYAGLSVEEIYVRQVGNCWLELEMDDVGGKKIFGELYCTDGKHRLPTTNLLNPSCECVKCLIAFIEFLCNGK